MHVFPASIGAQADAFTLAVGRTSKISRRRGHVSKRQAFGRGARRADRSLQVVFDYPSRLADALAAGDLDVALIPSIEYARHRGYSIISDACIACDGPVRSVKLFGRVPAEEIRTLALDEGSRTSAALARILLKERFGLSPEICPLPLGPDLDDVAADAAVLIGDRGMRPSDGSFEFVWDLGAEWADWTGLPFVFALWIARPGVDLPGLSETLAARATLACSGSRILPDAKHRCGDFRRRMPLVSSRQSDVSLGTATTSRAGAFLSLGRPACLGAGRREASFYEDVRSRQPAGRIS